MMIAPVVVSFRNTRDFGKPGDVRIDRASKWGNPFTMRGEYERDEVIRKYEVYLRNNERLLHDLNELVGAKRLFCWCAPKKCHGDVIVKVMRERGLVE